MDMDLTVRGVEWAKWSGWVLTTELIAATWPPFSTILLDRQMVLGQAVGGNGEKGFLYKMEQERECRGSLASIWFVKGCSSVYITTASCACFFLLSIKIKPSIFIYKTRKVSASSLKFFRKDSNQVIIGIIFPGL